jgi:DUF1707 SHOCT-like domain
MLDDMSRDEMRAADADRQAVAEKLKVALDEGRLDLHEYDDRLQRAYAAKTYGELNPLLADLPGQVPVVPVVAGFEPPAHPTVDWLREMWSSWIPVLMITTAIWAVGSLGAGHVESYWPVWVVGPWAAVLMVGTVTGLMSGEPQKRVEKRRRKALEKASRAREKESRALEKESRALEGEHEAQEKGRGAVSEG